MKNDEQTGAVVETTAATKSAEQPTESGEKRAEEPDFMLLNYYWSLLGIGFTSGLAFMLSCSLQKLKERHKMNGVR